MTVTADLPVLWLYGPPGVGKTTVAWALYTTLNGGGVATGYVDIDQLGMCYAEPTPHDWAPEPASDPVRHRLKARNLDAVAVNLRASGARCLIVSGIVDPAVGVPGGLLPHAALTACRLRAEPAELRRRLALRGRPGESVEAVLADAAALDRNGLPDRCVDTTGRSVAEVLAQVCAHTGDWPGPAGATAGRPPPFTPPATRPGPVLWLCGPTAVGKSTVGWHVYEQVRRAGFRAAFVDLQQIGFLHPAPPGDPGNHRLKAANLAALWQTFRDCGTAGLIAVGAVDRAAEVAGYRAALPAASLTLCRLHASPERLAERVALRGRGLGPPIPGDRLTGRPAAVLDAAASRAAADAEALARAAIGDPPVDTGDLPPAAAAAEVLRRTGWP